MDAPPPRIKDCPVSIELNDVIELSEKQSCLMLEKVAVLPRSESLMYLFLPHTSEVKEG